MDQYSIVAVSRTPNQTAAPTLVEVGPLAGAVGYWSDLYKPGGATVTVNVETLASDIKSRLRDLSAAPMEVWVYRAGTMVFAGPVVGGVLDGTKLTLNCRDLLYYLRYMLITTAKSWTATEQATIVGDLVDDWQDLDYGDFGIDTTNKGTTGTTRNQTLPGDVEHFNVLEEVLRLGEAANGFDVYVEHLSRDIKVSGSRGSDLSASVFLERGVRGTNVRFSVSPGLVASEVFVLGTDADSDPITTTATNATLRAAFGRCGYSGSVDSTDGDTTLLTDYATAWKNERDTQLFQPADQGLIPVAGGGATDFDVGDTVTYSFDAGLGRQTITPRIAMKRVEVGADGTENIKVEFV